MSISSYQRNWKAVVAVDGRWYDYALLYTLLRIIYEKQLAGQTVGLRDLWLEYRDRTGIKVNYYTVKRHIELAVEKGLVERTGTRPTKLKLTKKGVDYVFLFERLSELIR